MSKLVYALVGADPFLQLEELRDILSAMGGDAQRADFEGERAQLSQVLDELRSFSMFGSSRVVVVRDADEFVSKYRDALEDFIVSLGEGASGNTLVLRLSSLPSNQRIHKAISKVGEVRKCDPPKPADVPGWIMARAKSAHGAVIESEAARKLGDLIGPDLGRLDTELAKLAIGAESGKITSDDVAKTVSFQREQEIWEITTLLGRGKATEAITRWRQLIQADPSTEYRAVTWLGIWLENCRKILQAKDSGTPLATVGKQIRIWDPNVLKEFAATATKLGHDGVTRLLQELTEIDRRTKSGLGNAADQVERFMATALMR